MKPTVTVIVFFFIFTNGETVVLRLPGQLPQQPGDEWVPPDYDHEVDIPTTWPLNIGHRGSSGLLPENTKEAFSLAIDQGADVIECDICVTKDLHLVCLHESWMSDRTNVADVFNTSRMNTYFVQDDNRLITDYFSVDFTLEELQTIRMRQRFDFRDPNHDDLYAITSFEEFVQIAQDADRMVGLYPETKDPIWVNSLDILTEANTTLEDLLVEVLERYGYNSKSDPCFLQSFHHPSIQYLSNITDLPLTVLIGSGMPVPSNDSLQEFARYCYGLGISRTRIVVTNADGQIVERTDLVDRAHAFGLRIHPHTFRNEDRYLPWDYGQDAYLEFEDFLRLGIDGYFADFPESLHWYLEDTYNRREGNK